MASLLVFSSQRQYLACLNGDSEDRRYSSIWVMEEIYVRQAKGHSFIHLISEDISMRYARLGYRWSEAVPGEATDQVDVHLQGHLHPPHGQLHHLLPQGQLQQHQGNHRIELEERVCKSANLPGLLAFIQACLQARAAER